jgi:hypothetical protein
VLVQDEEEDDDDKGLDANTDADVEEHEDDGANVPSDVDADVDANTDANANPFPSPHITSSIQHSPHCPIILSLSSSSDGNYNTPLSSIHSLLKPKPKPQQVQPSPNLPTSMMISHGRTEVPTVILFFLCTHAADNTFTTVQLDVALVD